MKLKYQPSKSAMRLVTFVTTRAKTSLALGLILFAFLLVGGSYLDADFSYRSNLASDSPIILDYEEFKKDFGNDDLVVVAIHSDKGLFNKESLNLVKDITQEMWKVSDIIRVDSLTNFTWVRANGDDILSDELFTEETIANLDEIAMRKDVALSHPSLLNYLLSPDGTTALIYAQIRPDLQSAPSPVLITQQTNEIIERYSRAGHTFYVTGTAPMESAFEKSSEEDNSQIIPIVLLICLALLYFLSRSIKLTITCLTVILLITIASFTTMGWIGIQITSITAVLPQIILAIAIADTVHILATYMASIKNNTPHKDAVIYSLTKNFAPTLITSISTAVGFLSFTSSEIQPISGLGVAAGLGTLTAWILTYLIFGSLLFLITPKITQYPKNLSPSLLTKFGSQIISHPKKLVVFSTIFVLASAWMMTQVPVDADPINYFKKEHPLRGATEFIEENVGAARTLEIVINADKEGMAKDADFLAKVERYENWLESQTGVTKVLSIIDILKETNKALHNNDPKEYRLTDDNALIAQEFLLYTMGLPPGQNIENRISLKEDAVRLTMLWTIGSSSKALEFMKVMQSKASSLELDAVITGKYQIYQKMEHLVSDSFISSIGIALTLVSLLLIGFLRSIRLGLFALIPNIVPLIIGGAFVYLFGGTLNIGTVLIIGVCIGIAVDDSVHMLSEYSQLRRAGYATDESIEHIFESTVPSIMKTSLVLVLSFSAFALATFIPIQMFGLTTAITLAFAFLADITLLPALLLIFKLPISKLDTSLEALEARR